MLIFSLSKFCDYRSARSFGLVGGHHHRSAFVFHEDDNEFRRFGFACVLPNHMNIIGAFIAGFKRVGLHDIFGTRDCKDKTCVASELKNRRNWHFRDELRLTDERFLHFQLRRDSLRFTAMISVSPGAWRGVNNPGMSTEDGKVEKQSLFPAEHHIKNKDQLSERKNF